MYNCYAPTNFVVSTVQTCGVETMDIRRMCEYISISFKLENLVISRHIFYPEYQIGPQRRFEAFETKTILFLTVI